MVHDALLDVPDSYGARCLTIRPHVAGMPIADADGHKDYDSVCLHPDVARTRAPSRARQPPAPPVDDTELPTTRDPERQEPRDTPSCLSCLPLPNWTRRPEHQARVRVSMRFLRGLDPAKLAHNALDWRQRLHYVERRDGRLEQPQLLALQRMNAIIAAVASEHAVELLDVYELDRIAGFATEAADENFHVTQPMATSAAFALLLMLSGVGSSGVYL
ncbi:hypothetical protein Ctob_006241 [Chrysochromulina tobinii]|uniref:Uncharacterized protein n=1 Tax=Chrysochromulina tobinii TaxID=1460289 RepID=A0A0M0JQG7_9EUKA|nr:hypothetical protein Ctob_006241 [Chrysochromulina tobinii]|eukprot:KOO28537.1 hypothetical protein Ctob_006241 [Chrysochromulina sp. CCMP291]